MCRIIVTPGGGGLARARDTYATVAGTARFFGG